MFVTMATFDVASYVVDMLGAREKEVMAGKFGMIATMPDSLKFFTLLMIQAFGVWVSGYSLASNVDELVDFFNHYSDKTNDEGTDKKDGDADPHGTAIEHDLFFHGITTFYSWFLYSFIMFGGYYFAYYFGKFYPVSETCDVTASDAANYGSFDSAFAAIPNGSYTDCLGTMKTIFNSLDLDNNGFLDRCEDAKFLYWANNGNAEYA